MNISTACNSAWSAWNRSLWSDRPRVWKPNHGDSLNLKTPNFHFTFFSVVLELAVPSLCLQSAAVGFNIRHPPRCTLHAGHEAPGATICAKTEIELRFYTFKSPRSLYRTCICVPMFKAWCWWDRCTSDASDVTQDLRVIGFSYDQSHSNYRSHAWRVYTHIYM